MALLGHGAGIPSAAVDGPLWGNSTRRHGTTRAAALWVDSRRSRKADELPLKLPHNDGSRDLPPPLWRLGELVAIVYPSAQGWGFRIQRPRPTSDGHQIAQSRELKNRDQITLKP
jgi:hypothetical protein